MNRALFITIGIVLIVFVFLLWLFLFLYGAPSNTQEIFSDLGIVETTQRTVEPIPEGGIDESSVVLDLTDGQLQQITTNSVAGYGATSTTDGRWLLRYLERGTGHIYEVNLNSGLQTQVTPSTIPGANEAYFAPDLKSVVVVSERASRAVVLLTIPNNPDGPIEQFPLASDAENIEYLNLDTIAYTRNTYRETVGYSYDLNENTVTKRFDVGLPDAVVITTETGEVYTYPKPTAVMPGALYVLNEGLSLTPVSEMYDGLTAFVSSDSQVINYINEDKYESTQLPNEARQSVLMLPEKCVSATSSSTVWCGAPEVAPASNYIEDWYKGLITSNDWLWEINTLDGTAKTLAIPTQLIGREVDVVNMITHPSGDRFLFQNKTDASLWLFRL